MYPNIYKEDIKCTWDIHVPKGYKVALKFKGLKFFQIALESISILLILQISTLEVTVQKAKLLLRPTQRWVKMILLIVG